MRTIKFKVWDKRENKFFEYWCGNSNETLNELFVIDNHFVFMQYTGLKDCKDKEIYENDIVEYYDYRGDELIKERDKVRFKAGAFYPICMMPSPEFEVIGNIYENPELLNK